MRVLFFVIAGLFTTFIYAQATGSVRGKILDSEMFNEPLLMATVSLKNTDWSDRTNFNGNFEITDVAPGDYVMEISFLGYEPLEVPIKIKEDQQLEILESLKARTLTMPVMAETSQKMTSERSADPNY